MTPPPAPRRRLGRTALDVGPIALGTVKLGRNRGVKYPRPFDLPDDAAVRRLLDAALDLGVDLLDTAPAYGASEARLGALLGPRRARFRVCTKVGETFDGQRSTFDFTPAAIRASVERSLRRLRVDALDLVLVHADGRDVALIDELGVFDTLAALVDAGWIRWYGMSSKTVAGGLRAVAGSDVAMIAHSPADPACRPVLDAAAAAGAPVLIKKALASGHLAGGPDALDAALRPTLTHPGVASVVIGTLDPAHLAADVAAARRILGAPP